jgi:hypothetical protein
VPWFGHRVRVRPCPSAGGARPPIVPRPFPDGFGG